MWAGLAHQGPVPLRADDDTLAVATTAIALAGVSAAAVWLLLPDWQDRLIAGVMAWVLVIILTPTALTDLLHAANALRVEAGSRQQSVERFAALKEANPAKTPQRLLVTLAPDASARWSGPAARPPSVARRACRAPERATHPG